MPEEGKNMERDLGQKGGEMEQWEPDRPGDHYREIDKLKAQRVKEQLAGLSSSRKPRTETRTTSPRRVNGGPGNPDSVVPMNTDMVRPDARGRYRIVDTQGKVNSLPEKPR